MKYADIIRQMERQGNYCDAEDLRQSLEYNQIADFERVHSRSESYDGCDFYSVQHSAVRAYDEIKHKESED